MEEWHMSNKNIEKMKALIEEKKAKNGYLKGEKKIGSGRVEEMNKNVGFQETRTKKISQ